jgi:imidazoleglycerol-phosphate dehydratase
MTTIRTAEVNRETLESKIYVKVAFDGEGKSEIDTGIGFFNHMLTALSKHSGISMEISTKGDIDVDGHHTVEDTGIVLGTAFKKALTTPIARYGTATIPLDEALASCTVDISNRPFLVFNADFSSPMTGEFDTSLTEEFFRAFAVNAGITMHINLLYGKNDHHKIEAIFKAVAHALRVATAVAEDTLSTKGVL